MANETKLSVSRSHTSLDNRFLIGVIADEETTIGFLMAGIGEVNAFTRNYFIVNKGISMNRCVFYDQNLSRLEVDLADIERFFFELYNRKDMGAILIGADLFPKILNILSKTRHKKNLPILLEIPTRKTIIQNITAEEKALENQI